jgi:hypothetical protein
LTNLSGPEQWWEPPGSAHSSADNGTGKPPSRPGPTLPGETTEPTWVLASIVFGLLALTGSIPLISLIGTAAVLAWLIRASGDGGGTSPGRCIDPRSGEQE